MADPCKNYTFNHLIFLADEKRVGVLENNFSGKGAAMKRSLRTDSSPLNAGIDWKFPDAVCVVNAFMLKGNHDNFAGNASNVERWENFRKQLSRAGETVGPDEIKEIISTRVDSNSPKCGSIYNACTQQMMVYEPAENELEIFFRPRTGELPARPFFEKVVVDF
jgi:hypothetical protein